MTKKEEEMFDRFGPEIFLYLNQSIKYKKSLEMAIRCKKYYGMSPEQIQFIKNRHEQTIKLMEELEEALKQGI